MSCVYIDYRNQCIFLDLTKNNEVSSEEIVSDDANDDACYVIVKRKSGHTSKGNDRIINLRSVHHKQLTNKYG